MVIVIAMSLGRVLFRLSSLTKEFVELFYLLLVGALSVHFVVEGNF